MGELAIHGRCLLTVDAGLSMDTSLNGLDTKESAFIELDKAEASRLLDQAKRHLVGFGEFCQGQPVLAESFTLEG
jgi:hypothetical protein